MRRAAWNQEPLSEEAVLASCGAPKTAVMVMLHAQMNGRSRPALAMAQKLGQCLSIMQAGRHHRLQQRHCLYEPSASDSISSVCGHLGSSQGRLVASETMSCVMVDVCSTGLIETAFLVVKSGKSSSSLSAMTRFYVAQSCPRPREAFRGQERPSRKAGTAAPFACLRSAGSGCRCGSSSRRTGPLWCRPWRP